ncbi:hypothetical protein ESO86_17290, partial [Agromyces binzhouensis]
MSETTTTDSTTANAAVPPSAQSKYQVRFDHGTGGVRRIAREADVLVWVDQVADATGGAAADGGAPGLLVPRDVLADTP